MKCPKCGSRDIDFQESGGQSICVNCGTVLEENTIVSSIEFQETGDRSSVIGQYVAANCSKPFSGGSRMMGRHMDSRDAKDATLLNARRSITQLATSLRLPPLYVDRSYRLYQLALQRNFIFGRRQTHIAATCLYIVCRQEKSPHLLIDFADALQINVYVLGKSFLHFTRVLNINLPVVDPSLYMHRYASQLDFGEKMSSVMTTSLRVITRLKKDWIVMGRRPDGVCAAALLISARSHDLDVTQEEIAKLFRITTDTIRRRLIEFSTTPSAQLSLVEFHERDIDVEFDPPSFIKNIIKECGTSDSLIAGDDDSGCYEGDHIITIGDLERDEFYASTSCENLIHQSSVLVLSDGMRLGLSLPQMDSHRKVSTSLSSKQEERVHLYDDIYNDVLQESSLTQSDRDALKQEAREVEQNPLAVGGWGTGKPPRIAENKLVIQMVVGQTPHASENINFDGDEELDEGIYLFSREEQQKREIIWQKTFGSYMEERARRKREREQSAAGTSSDKYTQSGKLRKKYVRRATSSTNGASTSDVIMASKDSVRGASKKINYDALKGMFDGKGSFAPIQKVDTSHAKGEISSESKSGPSTTIVDSATSALKQPTTSSTSALVTKDEHEEDDDDMLMYDDGAIDQDYDYDDYY